VSNRIKGPEGSPIEGSNTRNVARVRTAASTPSAAQGSPAERVENVHITDTARALLALQEAVAQAPDMDSARVEQLRLSIEQQQYQPNAARIADRLMSLEGDLLAAGQDKKY
jgi:negative regulator of flagellin synthesis FlgM